MWKTCLVALLLSLAATSASAIERSFDGEVVVRSIAATRVAVFVDTDADSFVDHGFLLTIDIPMHGRLAVRFPSARVSFTEGYVRVMAEGKVYDLQVAGYPDSPATPSGMDVVTVIGSALQQSRGDSGCDVTRAHERDAGSCFSYGRE